MKKMLFFIFTTTLFINSGCNNDTDENIIEQGYIKINGVKKWIYDPELSISINGGNFTYDQQTGEILTEFVQLNITDPNQVLLNNFNSNPTGNSINLRFVINKSASGNFTTAINLFPLEEKNVIANYSFDNEPSTSVYALPNHKIFVKITNDIILIKFTDVQYGTELISGNFNFNY